MTNVTERPNSLRHDVPQRGRHSYKQTLRTAMKIHWVTPSGLQICNMGNAKASIMERSECVEKIYQIPGKAHHRKCHLTT